jgi:site-specific recombinase XerD
MEVMARRRQVPRDAELAALAEAWLDAQRSPRTRAAYALDLDRFLEWCVEAGVTPLRATPADIAAYVEAVEGRGDAGAATVARRVAALSSFFAFAVGADAVATNPVQAVTRPTVERVSSTPTLTPDQALTLLDVAERRDNRAAILTGLLVLDGLKLSEALAIDVGDLAGAPPALRVTLRSRGDHEVTLHERTSGAVDERRREVRSGPLLTTASSAHRGARLTRFGADHLLKRLGVAAGLDVPVSANALRRSLVAHALGAGRDLSAIQAQLGHRDPRTTRRLATSS